MSYTIAQLRERFPSIEWGVPLCAVYLEGGPNKFVCRVCVANFGLKVDSPHQWDTVAEFEEHLSETHL